MDIHGCPWISMDIRGCPWISMDIQRCPRLSTHVHGCPRCTAQVLARIQGRSDRHCKHKRIKMSTRPVLCKTTVATCLTRMTALILATSACISEDKNGELKLLHHACTSRSPPMPPSSSGTMKLLTHKQTVIELRCMHACMHACMQACMHA